MNEDEDLKDPPLQRAVLDRDITHLTKLLEQDEFIDLQDDNGNTALHLATSLGYSDAFKLLIEHFACLNLKNKFEETPLHVAIKKRDENFVKKLINLGTDVNAQNLDGNNALMLAVLEKFEAAIDLLLKQNSGNPSNVNGNSCIHLAVLQKNSQLLEMILQNGSFSNSLACKLDEKLRNALQLAIESDFQHGFELLLSQDITQIENQDIQERTALHIAIHKRNNFMVEKLINNMPDKHAMDENTMTAFELAVATHMEFAVSLFLKKAIENKDDTGKASFPLHVAVFRKDKKHLNELLDGGGDIDYTDNQGRTPLHWATIRNFSGGVNMLLSKGACIDAEDSIGNTALHYAVLGKYKCLMETLVARGANVNLRNEADLAVIHLAAMHNFPAGIKFLFEQGADINMNGGNKGFTPLHFAVFNKKYKRKNALKTILSLDGLELSARSIDGHSRKYLFVNALDIALMNGLDSTSFLLLEKGIDVSPFDVRPKIPLLNSAICRYKKNLNMKLLHKLCEMGGDVRGIEKDYYGCDRGDCANDCCYGTPLHEAALHKYASVSKLLIDKGASPDEYTVDSHDRTELHCATIRKEGCTHSNLDRPNLDQTENTTEEEESLCIVNMLIDDIGIDIHIEDRIGQTALHYASSSGFGKVVDLLVENGANVNDLDNHNCSALHKTLGAKIPNLKIAEKLLHLGVNANHATDQDETPLHYAIKKSSRAAVKLLLAHGADVNVMSTFVNSYDDGDEGENLPAQKFPDLLRNNQLTLPLAAGLPNRIILEILINQGADINQKTQDGTALHSAASNKHYHNIKLLLKNNISMNEVDQMGNTALHSLCRECHPTNREASFGILKLLLAHGIDINHKRKDGNTALHLASKHMEERAVKLFFNYGAIINEQDVLGNTPLHNAAIEKKEDIVDLLVNSGADVHLRNKKGETIFHLIFKHKLKNCLYLILREPCALSAQDEKGNTCLHIAVLVEDLYILQQLLSINCDLKIKNEERLTATFLAASKGFQPGIKLLLENEIKSERCVFKADEETLLNSILQMDTQLMKQMISNVVNVNDKGRKSALHLAVLCDFKLGVEALIKAGANVNDKDSQGNTSLHMAAIVRSREIMEVLLINDADVHSLNDDKRTAAHLAGLVDFKEGISLPLNKSASLALRDRDGNTPLYLAMSTKTLNISRNYIGTIWHLKILQEFEFGVKAIVKSGAEINDLLNDSSSLSFAKINEIIAMRNLLPCDKNDRTELIDMRTLANFSEDIDTLFYDIHRLGWGKTPFYLTMPTKNTNIYSDLHLSVLHKYEFGVEALLKAGAAINDQGMHGYTPLHFSSIVKEAEIMKMLLENSARLQIKNKDGKTALHLATLCGFAVGVQMLIDKGALLDAQDQDGSTPLHLAFAEHNYDIVILLIQSGAKMDIFNHRNKSFTSLRIEQEMHALSSFYRRSELRSLENLLLKLKTAIAENIESVYDPHPELTDRNLKIGLKKELNKMEFYCFGQHALLDLFKDHKDPQFIKNESLMQIIGSPCLEEEFPSYALLLKSRFKSLERKYNQLNHACRLPMCFELSSQEIINLPTEIKRKILSELSVDDLDSVIEVVS